MTRGESFRRTWQSLLVVAGLIGAIAPTRPAVPFLGFAVWAIAAAQGLSLSRELIAVQEAENLGTLQALAARPEIKAEYRILTQDGPDLRGLDVVVDSLQSVAYSLPIAKAITPPSAASTTQTGANKMIIVGMVWLTFLAIPAIVAATLSKGGVSCK